MSGYNLLINDKDYIEYPNAEPWIGFLEEQKGTVIHVPDVVRSFKREKAAPMFFGNDGHIKLLNTELLFRIIDNQVHIDGDLSQEAIFLNHFRIYEKQFSINPGDVLFIAGVKILFFDEIVRVIGEQEKYQANLMEIATKVLPFEDYPYYKRSPRIIKRVPEDKIEIKEPPQKAGLNKTSLLQTLLPPLGMMAVTVGVGMMMGRGMFLLMSIAGTGMTSVVSVVKFFSERKERKESDAKRLKLYENYLLNKRKEIFTAYEKEKDAYDYNYPSIAERMNYVQEYNSRLYERVNTDDDFLTLSIGKQEKSVSFAVNVKENELSMDDDTLATEGKKIKDKFSLMTKDKVINLKNAHLGLVGNKEVIHEQLNLYISQLAIFQSYQDLQIIVIYDSKYDEDFQWVRWLPHNKIQSLNLRGMINSERSRDQILNSLNQILKDRQLIMEESKKEAQFAPHYLFIIDEPKMIMDHFIMEFLGKTGQTLDFSIIYTSYLQENLPENIGTVVILEDSNTGRLLLEENILKDETVQLERVGSHNLETMSRTLSTITHVQGIASQIPEAITFFDMFGVMHPQELNVRQRWSENQSHKSLAVPLGVRAQDDYVYLNLHEKAHGPHGLIAGTTGSGKSELVQSYILSLAVNFHPYEVGFLLIDYKGGGMASLFKDLPHLLGTITNLDGSESMRAMASIKSEMERRQRIFNENEVNHINAYNQLFKEGAVAEPLPHLFLISDEFAELKKEQPEFMKELVSASRIGRSLGVHLILATQKPTGVVDDQIWSNSKFKLCLKVQNEGDSKEILKTPDAASIVQAGRAYLQVGNNEIYELFQSAWSGAPYVEEQEKEVTMDNRVYLINELGQGELINQDLSGKKEETMAKDTQLDVVVQHVKEVYEQEETIEITKPWLPPLEKQILSPVLQKEGRTDEPFEALKVSLGLLDVPETQTQEDYVLDLITEGNVAYFASSGYGKSVFLTTAAMSLAKHYSVPEVIFYVLDFGNNALITLRNLPHTAEYITIDDDERYRKFKPLIFEEIKSRKKKFAQIMAQNIRTYNQMSEEKLPAIVIFVDNYDAIKEMGFEEEEYFTKVSRDGSGLGIYFIITSSRTSAVRNATLNSFRNKIAGFNFDSNETLTIVGRSQYTLPEVKGRALIKRGELVSMMQLYIMSDASTEVEYIKDVKELAEQIREEHPGEEAPHIPILPEELTFDMFDNFNADSSDVYLGLETGQVYLSGLRRMKSPFLILGEGQKGKTNALKILLAQLAGKEQLVIFDSKNMDLFGYQSKDKVNYIQDFDAFVAYMDVLEKEVVDREKVLKERMQEDISKMPQEIAAEFEPYYIFIDDIDDFHGLKTTSAKDIADMFHRAVKVGITIVASGHVAKLKGADDITKWFKTSANGLLVSQQGYQNVFSIPVHQDKVALGEGLLVSSGNYCKVKLPKMS